MLVGINQKIYNVPKNIEIIYLLPYLPKLNPIERLWLHIKQDTLHNKTYNTIALLKSVLRTNLLPLSQSAIKHLCNVIYLTY
ncbi:transposase [Wolbachia endosymbiont of Litomosoides sigmodontis]|uniref:transposase n=1 Tax=Wolbachia endosymbiont of Litomosoides sigmodontis TaxID=80850 RepID=UPI001588D9A0